MVVQLDGKVGTIMGKPQRLDSPKKITLSLSELCHEQARELANLMSSEPGRRTAVSLSEIVERAVAAFHQATRPVPVRVFATQTTS